MERDLDEMLLSQEKMLQRLNRPAAPREKILQAYTLHLERLHEWLRQQRHVEILHVRYNDLVEAPQKEAQCVCEFLGRQVNIETMAQTVDRSLYRNRKPSGDRSSDPVAPAGAECTVEQVAITQLP